MGRAENKERKKKWLCIFETDSNNSIQTQIQRIQIQIEQQAIKNAVQHECNTNKTTSIIFEDNQLFYFIFY